MENKHNQQAEGFAWVTNDFVDHNRTLGWYLGLGAITALIAVATYFLNGRDWFAASSIVVAAVVLAVFTTRKPSQTRFQVTAEGVYVNDKLHSYNDFKSFSIIQDHQRENIHLTPVKRMSAPINLEFPEEQGQALAEFIGEFLPFEPKQANVVDSLASRFKF